MYKYSILVNATALGSRISHSLFKNDVQLRNDGRKIIIAERLSARLMIAHYALAMGIYIYRKSLNRSLPQIEACLKLTPGVLQNLV